MAAEEILGKAVLELTGNLAPLTKSLEEGKAASEEMASTTATGFKSGITKAAIPAAIAIAGIAEGLHKSVEAAMDDQVAEGKLTAAYKAAGLNIDKYKDSIDKTEQSSAALGFKSEDIKASLAQLIVATQNHTQALNLLSTAQDVARFKGIDLSSASKLLTQTMAGSARAAHTLGINIAPVTTATDALKAKTQYASLAAYEHAKATAYLSDKQATARKMVELLNTKLGGQAEAFSKTAEGAKQKMGAEFQLLEINIGKTLLPILTKLSGWFASFSELLVKHASVVKIVIAVIGGLASAILVVAGATKAWELAQWLLNESLLANPIFDIILAIGLLVAAIVVAWQHSQTFRDIVLGVFDDIKGAVSAFVSFFTTTLPDAFNAVVTSAGGVRDKLIGAFQDVIHWFENTWTSVTHAIEQPFKDAWSFISGVPGDITSGFGTIRSWFDNAAGWAIKHLITQPFDDAWQFIKGIPDDIVNAFKNIKGDIAKAFTAIGEAVKNAFTGPIDAVISAINSIELPTGIHIKTWHGIPDGFSLSWSHPFHIPALAEGGIINSPTVAMIGEKGPEAVVPLGKGGLGGITVNVSGVVGNERDVAIRIGRELQRLQERGLSFGLA